MARDIRVTTSRNPSSDALSGAADVSASPAAHENRSKLSVNVTSSISERLRSLAYLHRLSESSIVEIALAMFFARGDDELLGVMLRQLGATRRSK
jgi:hypothetical protein